MRRNYTALLLLLLAAYTNFSADKNRRYDLSRGFDTRESAWVDSVFDAMSESERIGQLLMIRAHSNKDTTYERQVEDLVRQYAVGGLCFFQGTPEKQAILTNRYQLASPRIPLLVSMDAEWGLGMRLKETVSYPKQLMLGAIQDKQLIYQFGREVARQCRRLGVQVNFAPVADINNNPANPVINDRSFGEDKDNVIEKCVQYMHGLQDGGVMACAKHFPGHGDTNTDSHFDLPIIAHSAERLDSLELTPFRRLSSEGVGSFMVAHLNLPALDDRAKRPTTLSEQVVYKLLREKIGFQGIIFTDAMEMQAVTKYFAPGAADVEALRAGNDMILLPADVPAAVLAIRQALANGVLDSMKVHASVKRILRAKYRFGLTKPQTIRLEGLPADLNSPEAFALKRKLIQKALTLVRDEPGLCGFPDLANPRFASLALGDTNRTIFQTYCGYYAPMQHFNAGKYPDSLQQKALLDSLKQYQVVFLSLHNMRARASDNFGLNDTLLRFIERLRQETTIALTVFGNPYSLKYFDQVPILMSAYNEDPITQELAAQAWFGAQDLEGRLPITASEKARFGQGIRKQFPFPRLAYDLPVNAGMQADTLAQIDELMAEMIRTGAIPGGQILIARQNKIVWHKAYGYFTYEQTRPVGLEDLYDLASVTKIAGATVSAMLLQDEGKFELDQPITHYIPELAGSNKQDLHFRSVLAHHAGLVPWIAFYKNTLENNFPDPHIYHRDPDADSDIPVAPGMYMANAWLDSIWQMIVESPVRVEKTYKYSDLGLYLLNKAIQNITHQNLDVFAPERFYRPLGMGATTFNPWKRGWEQRSAPTEEDRYFRQQKIQGYVHDMGAAMLGGVSGHAGLFSNANDLCKLAQMLLNNGQYAGRQYLKAETVEAWTRRFNGSTRRGIGFDMKELDPDETQNVSPLAGPNTFGHTGFTGIALWVDPDKDLIFIFLSNRTYPFMDNNKLINGNYRPRIQSIIYQSIAP